MLEWIGEEKRYTIVYVETNGWTEEETRDSSTLHERCHDVVRSLQHSEDLLLSNIEQ